jgi:hypothetical protein
VPVMNLLFYEIIKTEKGYSTFQFTSVGKKNIVKVVTFQKTQQRGVYNLAMGDMIGKWLFSDIEISNNGDIRKVLTTVVNIVQIYTRKYPTRKIFITGNTPLKTIAYQRIIRMYHSVFINEFDIWGYIDEDVKEPFNLNGTYIAFIVKRKKTVTL